MDILGTKKQWIPFHPVFNGCTVNAGVIAFCDSALFSLLLPLDHDDPDNVLSWLHYYEMMARSPLDDFDFPLMTSVYCVGVSYSRKTQSHYCRFDVGYRQDFVCGSSVSTSHSDEPFYLPVRLLDNGSFVIRYSDLSDKRIPVFQSLIKFLISSCENFISYLSNMDSFLEDSGL